MSHVKVVVGTPIAGTSWHDSDSKACYWTSQTSTGGRECGDSLPLYSPHDVFGNPTNSIQGDRICCCAAPSTGTSTLAMCPAHVDDCDDGTATAKALVQGVCVDASEMTSHWALGGFGDSCEATCLRQRGYSSVCDVDYQHAVVTRARFENVQKALGLTNMNCDSYDAAADSSTSTSPPSFIVEGTTTSCKYVPGSTPQLQECDESPGATERRICCCSAGANAVTSTMCPTNQADCPNDLTFVNGVCRPPPTTAPTEAPTASPSQVPTQVPTSAPTSAPTFAPTSAPTFAPTFAPTDAPTDAPTSAPTQVPTSAPTDAPTLEPTAKPTMPTQSPTAAPSTSAPTTAPSAAPTSAPTHTLGNLIERRAPASLTLREDGADGGRDLFTVNSAAAAATLEADETATIECAASDADAVVLSPASVFRVEASGRVSPAGGTLRARGVPDAAQLARRSSTVSCTVRSSDAAREEQQFTFAVAVLGVAQPSFKMVCVLGDLNSSSTTSAADASAPIAELGSCGAAQLTTNGGAQIVILGCTDGARCPQPPFGADTVVSIIDLSISFVCSLFFCLLGAHLFFVRPSFLFAHLFCFVRPSKVSIDGIRLATTLVPGVDGTRLVVTTPTIAEMEARGAARGVDFAFNKYYALTITTAAGEHGVIEGGVDLGPGGARDVELADDTLRCAATGLCPDAMSRTSGVYYAKRCVGYLDPTDPAVVPSWDTNDPTRAQLFAFGTPPNCRPCPEGCRCSGGDRCQAVEGYYVDGEGEGGEAPTRCAPPAVQRCAGYSDALGEVQCGTGFAQEVRGCGACAQGFYKEVGGACLECPSVDLVEIYALPMGLNAGSVALVFPALALVKFLALTTSSWYVLPRVYRCAACASHPRLARVSPAPSRPRSSFSLRAHALPPRCNASPHCLGPGATLTTSARARRALSMRSSRR